jgi:hypothetical protein
VIMRSALMVTRLANRARPRRTRERGRSAFGAVVVLALLGALGYGIYYCYGWTRVSAMETAFSRRLADAARPTPTEQRVDAELVTKRLIRYAREEHFDLEPGAISVVIEPLDPTNVEKLAVFERAAIGIAGQLKNYDVDAMFLGIRVTVQPKWGPVTRTSVLERSTWVPKSALR